MKAQQQNWFNALVQIGFIFCFIMGTPSSIFAQTNTNSLYKVLTLTGIKQGAMDLPQDHGATGIWQRLLKLQTTASVLHTQVHPDDEHADLLTYLSRGKGVRTALLSLNRGESGANVLGAELFDQLGLLRTEEFLLAGSYYGLDDLYFTKLADYGFSKRVAEAYEKWGKENVLREMVRVIRINRPLVIISRFHGTERDGHGNHQAAGEISQLAYQLTGDSAAFPEQLTGEGLRPWKALKLYRGGIRQNEHWNIELNTGDYCPWLGQSYKNFSLLGYSMHRSQNGGNRNIVNGPFKMYYERLQSMVKGTEKESGFFDGIDTSLTGIFTIT
ncbi:MAG: PIG-L family deacetylase, partial [Thermoproteota archaeon]|nr:PIG-L family deacetylase [Thermoproteota archaeon]